MVLGEELDRLWEKVQEPDSCIALNVSHIQWSQFEGAAIKAAFVQCNKIADNFEP
jgi:hypothetical protein